jgi:flagellin-like hook-associated protein FlgL
MHNEPLIAVADNPHLRRDVNTGAIIDVDTDAYNNYVKQRADRVAQRARLSQLEDRINNFESDLSDIKSLLTRLLEK